MVQYSLDMSMVLLLIRMTLRQGRDLWRRNFYHLSTSKIPAILNAMRMYGECIHDEVIGTDTNLEAHVRLGATAFEI
jgi:hypothetical protein